MDSQLTPPSLHNVSYDIPRFVIGEQGSQNRHSVGEMKLTAGIAQPLDIRTINKDGVPINLTQMKVYLVFWSTDRFDLDEGPNGYSLDNSNDITLRKNVEVIDPYKGTCTVLLKGEDTEIIARKARSNSVRWGVFLINEDKDVFAMSVTSTGEVYGSVIVQTGTVPSYESIIG